MPLYFAYGANMDVAAMARRCPRSKPLGLARLMRHRLAVMREGWLTASRDPRAERPRRAVGSRARRRRRARPLRGARRRSLRQGRAAGRRRGRGEARAGLFRRQRGPGGRRRTISPACSARRGAGICRRRRSRARAIRRGRRRCGLAGPRRGPGDKAGSAALRHAVRPGVRAPCTRPFCRADLGAACARTRRSLYRARSAPAAPSLQLMPSRPRI